MDGSRLPRRSQTDPLAVVLEAPNGAITGWDDGAQELFGYAAGEALGKTVAALLGGSEGLPLEGESGGADDVVTVRARDGTLVRASRRRSQLCDAQGVATATCSVFTPVAQRDSERAQLEAVIESLPGALLSFERDREGRCRFTRVSAGSGALLGMPVAQLQHDAEAVIARIHPEDLHGFQQTQAESMATGGAWRCEFRYEHPVCGERWLLCSAVLARTGADGSAWEAIWIDITLHNSMAADLARAEAQLSSALEAADMGAWIFDATTGKVWGNRQQREMWEAPADEPPWYDKARCDSQIHEDDREEASSELMQALSGAPLQNEFRIVRSDGSVRWISARARVVPNSQGKRIAGVNLDITQQKLQEEKALRSQKLEVLGMLAGGIAHDFNNVLFAIVGNADVALLEASRGRDHRPMLLEVRSAAERAAALIRQILAFSRPDGQPNQRIDLAEAVNGALTIVRATKPSSITLTTRFDPGTPSVCADASRVGQVVMNLCTNAIHAIGRGRKGNVSLVVEAAAVTLDAEAQLGQLPAGAYALLRVEDDGCGMDLATQARIFDPFFTTKPAGEGTGLGLSIVQKIAQALDARIAVHSTPGAGTRFEVYFPAAEVEPAPPQTATAEPALGGAQHVLFVDDEPMLVTLGGNLLRSLGYRPEVYSRPTEALTAFERDPYAYAVVITDLAMPAMTGIEFARRILQIRPDVPVVLMSGNLTPEDHSAAMEIGIRETVHKPADLTDLSTIIARYVAASAEPGG